MEANGVCRWEEILQDIPFFFRSGTSWYSIFNQCEVEEDVTGCANFSELSF